MLSHVRPLLLRGPSGLRHQWALAEVLLEPVAEPGLDAGEGGGRGHGRDLRRHLGDERAVPGVLRHVRPLLVRGPCGLGHQRTAAEILLEPGAGDSKAGSAGRDDTPAAALSPMKFSALNTGPARG